MATTTKPEKYVKHSDCKACKNGSDFRDEGDEGKVEKLQCVYCLEYYANDALQLDHAQGLITRNGLVAHYGTCGELFTLAFGNNPPRNAISADATSQLTREQLEKFILDNGLWEYANDLKNRLIFSN